MGVGRSPSSGMGVRRTSYPSGAWVDSHGNPAKSPNKTSYYSSTSAATGNPGNPNPNNWKLLKVAEHGRYLIAKIQYPDCTNYEGTKILVFENLSTLELVNQRSIDPHFFVGGSSMKSPVARFVPTDAGWRMAEKFVKAMG